MEAKRQILIAGRTVGAGRTFVIAELAWSHDGKAEQALALIRGAAEAGADAVSLHATDLDAYMVPHYGAGEGRVSAGKDQGRIFQYLKRINLPEGCWPGLFAEARRLGLAVAVMANDEPSLERVRPLAPDIQVLASSCFMEEGFVKRVAGAGAPVFLRTGGATLAEIGRVLGWLAAAGDPPVVLLHGQQNYPTKIENTRLLQMATLGRAFGVPAGLADHVDGDDPMALHVPLAAVALGAAAVEKHITLRRADRSEDFESAIEPAVLSSLVRAVRAMEQALGPPTLDLMSPSQEAYRLVVRKRAVARRELPAGHVLAAGDLAFKRSDSGLFPDEAALLVGRTLGRAVAENEGLEWSVVR